MLFRMMFSFLPVFSAFIDAVSLSQEYLVFQYTQLNDRHVHVSLVYVTAKPPIGFLYLVGQRSLFIKIDLAFRIATNSQFGLTAETRLASEVTLWQKSSSYT
jgi:hypothetical protein